MSQGAVLKVGSKVIVLYGRRTGSRGTVVNLDTKDTPVVYIVDVGGTLCPFMREEIKHVQDHVQG